MNVLCNLLREITETCFLLTADHLSCVFELDVLQIIRCVCQTVQAIAVFVCSCELWAWISHRPLIDLDTITKFSDCVIALLVDGSVEVELERLL